MPVEGGVPVRGETSPFKANVAAAAPQAPLVPDVTHAVQDAMQQVVIRSDDDGKNKNNSNSNKAMHVEEADTPTANAHANSSQINNNNNNDNAMVLSTTALCLKNIPFSLTRDDFLEWMV
jgi:cytoskeletal protein RodZ